MLGVNNVDYLYIIFFYNSITFNFCQEAHFRVMYFKSRVKGFALDK